MVFISLNPLTFGAILNTLWGVHKKKAFWQAIVRVALMGQYFGYIRCTKPKG